MPQGHGGGYRENIVHIIFLNYILNYSYGRDTHMMHTRRVVWHTRRANQVSENRYSGIEGGQSISREGRQRTIAADVEDGRPGRRGGHPPHAPAHGGGRHEPQSARDSSRRPERREQLHGGRFDTHGINAEPVDAPLAAVVTPTLQDLPWRR